MRKRLLLLTMAAAMTSAVTLSVSGSAAEGASWRYETAGDVSAGGEITVFADGLEGQCTLISAIYCDGILAEASAAECSEGDNTVSIAVPEEFSNEHVWTLKAFVWDGLSSMKPIADSFEATLTDIDITDKFTDANFLAAVREALGKGETDRIYNSDVNTVTELTVTDKEIHSLVGIEYFTALEKLDCTYNKIEALNVAENTKLKALDCEENMLTSLDVSQNTKLEILNCSSNSLTALDVSKNEKLKELYCYFNYLTTLDVSSNKELEQLDCGYNPDLTSLNVSNNPKLILLRCEYSNVVSLKPLNSADLIKIVCYENEMEELDISNNVNLEHLNCWDNNFTSLDISNNKKLAYLDCRYNKMKSVDDAKGLTEEMLSNTENFKFFPQAEDITNKFTDANFLAAVREALGKGEMDRIYNSDVNTVTELTVTDKEIHSLVGIEYFTALEKLDCTHNNIEELDVSKNMKLKELVSLFNRYTSLDVSANKELEFLDCGYNAYMTSLNVSDNPKLTVLYCEYASLTSLSPANSVNLVILACFENELEELNISNNTNLEEVACYKNNLTSLDISNNKNLTYLDCSYNRMKSVDDIKGLTEDLQAQLETYEFNPQRTE